MAQTHVLTAVLTPDVDGGYVAQVAELPGAISQGETVEEALANVREAAELYLEDAAAEDPRSGGPAGRSASGADRRAVPGGKLATVIDRRHRLSEVPDAPRYLGEGPRQGQGRVIVE